MNKTLPNDICRCMDDGCSERTQCLRWLHRHRSYNNGMVSMCQSLFPYDIPLSDPCPLRIPVNDETLKHFNLKMKTE